MANDTFDTDPRVYEALVNWTKRLHNESSLLRDLVHRANARRILDAACGTGHHAAMFHSWGLDVEAADISPAMLNMARQLHGQPPRLRWVERGFTDRVETQEPFGLVVCIGNSLALVPTADQVTAALENMLGCVCTGGAVIVQVLNLWRLPDGPCVWQKFVRTQVAGSTVAVAKGVHRAGQRGYVDVVITPLTDDSPPQAKSVPLLGLRAEFLSQAAQQAGACRVELFGDYHGHDYGEESSADLIVIAWK